MSKLRILLADDHDGFRRVLHGFLQAQHGIEIVGEAIDGNEAIEKTGTLRPDLILMDVHMPHHNGLEATRQIKNRYPSTKVFILSMDPTELYSQNVQNIADGYITKTSMKDALLTVLAHEQSNRFSTGAIAVA